MGDLIPFDGGRVPSVLAGRTSNSIAAAQAGVQASFAVIGYKGRNWRLKYRGEDELMKEESGNPMPNLDVVIVGVSPSISKQWYEKSYTEGSDASPDCFSLDGMQPDATSPKKQCATCVTCPKNAWGSRVTEDGKKGKACQDSRRLAVVPLGDIENEVMGGPMLLRLPPMSLTNFANYAQFLERKGVPGTEFVGTRLGFDYDVAYPRITFQALGWVSDEQAALLVGPDGQGGVCADENIRRMLNEVAAEAVSQAGSQAGSEEPDALDQGAPPQVLQQRVAPAGTAPVAETAPASEAAPVAAPQLAASSAPAPSVPRRAATAFSAGPTPPAAAPTAPQAVQPASAPIEVTALPPTPDTTGTAPQVSHDNGAVGQAPGKPPTTIAAAPSDMLSAIDELLAAPAVAG